MTQGACDRIIRHFDLVAEGLRSEIRSVAEVVGRLVEWQKRIQLGQQAFLESVRRLETSQHALAESLRRLETAQQLFAKRGDGITARVLSPGSECLS